MDRATLRFYGELADLLDTAEQVVSVGVVDSPGVKGRIEACGVPHTEVDLIVVDGAQVGFGYQLRAGDRIGVYPAFHSLPVSGGLRPQPPRGRFVVDVNLGKLARYLRLLGFDALSDGALDDEDLADISAGENRILLTRDRNLLKRSIIVHGYCVRAVWPREQLVEVIRRFDLADAVDPFARCMQCNGFIEAVAKRDVEHLLEPLTKEHYEDFRRCTNCGRVFWRGSHFEQLEAIVDSVETQ